MARTAAHTAARTLGALAVAAGAGMWLSCASIATSAPVRLAPASQPSAWDEIVAEHTRRHEPYHWLARQADLRATLVTPRLRQAFLAHRAEFFGKFSDEAERELVGMGVADEGVDAAMKPAPGGEEEVVVFVAMYVADQKNRDLAASYTIWDSTLVRGGARAKPIKIETVRPSPAVVALFPYVDRFDDLYVMRFPRQAENGAPFLSAGGAPLALEVKSALAEARVEWVLGE